MSTLSQASQTPQLTAHEIKVLLVDDQAMIGEAVRRMLADYSDIVFRYCNDPMLAMETAEEFEPTLILQDLVMPQIDGLEMVRRFRASERTKDVPMIVLSSKEEPKIKAEAFSLGANDYIVKLPDKVELIARIRYHSNAYINLLQRNEAFNALVESQKVLAAELSEAAEYVKSLLPAPTEDRGIKTSWEFITSTSLGGDAFGYHWLDDDHYVLFLLDVCGHGVGAALLSVSAMNTIGGRTLPGVDFRNPTQVIDSLNVAFAMEKHNNMYFTLWYGVYSPSTRKLRYSSAGHPPAVMVAPGADTPELLRTPGMIVGGMPGVKFVTAETTVPAGARLYLLSDGTYEVRRPGQAMMELPEFADILVPAEKTADGKIQEVITEIRRQQDNDSFEDDFSLVEFQIA